MPSASISRLSPVFAALVLIGMIFVGGANVSRSASDENYFQRIEEKIGEIPYQIDAWNGVDEPVTEPARRLLRPNALFQRLYRNRESGEWFSLLIVHCRNTRDMEGHYPPICYKAHGWTQLSARSTSIGSAPDGQVPATSYHFESPKGRDETTKIFGFFVVPSQSNPYAGNMDTLSHASRASSSAGIGAAQVQLLTDGKMDDARREEIAQMVLREIEPALQLIARGITDDE